MGKTPCPLVSISGMVVRRRFGEREDGQRRSLGNPSLALRENGKKTFKSSWEMLSLFSKNSRKREKPSLR